MRLIPPPFAIEPFRPQDTSGLVGWWPFEGNGIDQSLSGANATLVGGVPIIQGPYGGGIQTTTGKYASATVPALTTFSLFAWVMVFAPITIEQDIFADAPFNFILFNTNDKFSAWNGAATMTGTTNQSAFNWYHVGLTSNGTTRRLYVNGREEVNAAAGASGITAGTATFGNLGGLGREWFGQISDVRLYNRTLTPNEIYVQYAEAVSRRLETLDPLHFVPPVSTTFAAFSVPQHDGLTATRMLGY